MRRSTDAETPGDHPEKGEPTMDERGKKRLTLDFDPGAFDYLEELALQSGKTKAGLIRSALAVYAVAKDEEKKKNRLAIIDEDGKAVKQLIIT